MSVNKTHRFARWTLPRMWAERSAAEAIVAPRVNLRGTGAPTIRHAEDAKRPAVSERFDTRRPRILYAANVASFFTKFLLPYAEHFRSHGWQVDAMSKGFFECDAVDFAECFDHLWEVDWARKPHELRRVGALIREIREITEREEYDIVHVHTPVAAMITRYALRKRDRNRTALLYTAHGFHFFAGAPRLTGTIYKGLESVASRWTDHLVVMNEEDLGAARALKGLAQDRVSHMPGIGIDLERYKPCPEAGAEVRRELDVPLEDVLFICVAEFIPRKRQADVIQALSLLGDAHANVAFAGDGETLNRMRELARTLGLIDQIRFLGLRRDIPRLLAASDCFILPSAQEGLPRSVMEAMGCGIPIIATDIRGNRDLLVSGAGALYPVGDVSALAGHMKEFMKDPGQRRAASLTGMLHVKKYDIKSVLRMHEELYASALGSNRESLISPKPTGKGYLV